MYKELFKFLKLFFSDHSDHDAPLGCYIHNVLSVVPFSFLLMSLLFRILNQHYIINIGHVSLGQSSGEI